MSVSTSKSQVIKTGSVCQGKFSLILVRNQRISSWSFRGITNSQFLSVMVYCNDTRKPYPSRSSINKD